MTKTNEIKYPYCNQPLPQNVETFLKTFSEEQSNSFHAIQELLCFHNSRYGINEIFKVEMPNSEIKQISISSTIGQGGSKKAALLEDGSVAMFPNVDQDNFIKIANWWPETVTKESAIAQFLEEINVPALNRKKAHLIVQKHDNSEIQYKLPILISDSFQQYQDKGWFIIDIKNSQSTIHSPKALEKWNLELKTWVEPLKPLLKDLYTLQVNNVPLGRDSKNLVLLEKESGDFEVHYFGFDFGGKYGSIAIPEKLKHNFADSSIESICSSLKRDMSSLDDFFASQLYKKYDIGWNQDKVVDKFIEEAVIYFSSCEFIIEALGMNENNSVEL